MIVKSLPTNHLVEGHYHLIMLVTCGVMGNSHPLKVELESASPATEVGRRKTNLMKFTEGSLSV